MDEFEQAKLEEYFFKQGSVIIWKQISSIDE